MPQHCFNRPNRSQPRRWTARAAARAVCAALEAGHSASELRREFANCVPCTETRRRAQSAVQAAAASLDASNTTLALADGALTAFEVVFRTLGRITRFVPQARGLVGPTLALERSLGVVRAEIRATRAANDATIRVLRLAA